MQRSPSRPLRKLSCRRLRGLEKWYSWLRSAVSPPPGIGEGISSQASSGSSQRCGPLPRAILFRWGFRSHNQGRSFFGGCPLHLACRACLHRMPQCEPQIPHPLTSHLPQFLPTLGGGTPAIGIFFDIFRSSRCELRPHVQERDPAHPRRATHRWAIS
jgi:hypothetical protein